MGKLNLFEIRLSDPQGIYYAGQMVQGNCVLELTDSIKMREIRIDVLGCARVRWMENRQTKVRSSNSDFSNTEEYIRKTIVLLRKDPEKKEDIELHIGRHRFPFRFLLPQGCPNSYEASIGYVRYSIAATIDRPWAFDDHTKKDFTVVNLLDLNKTPGCSNRGLKEDQTTLCCLCCESDPIKATLVLERLGYVPGESIAFKSEIHNTSRREMECTKARLIMEVNYHARLKSKKVQNVVAELQHGSIPPRGVDRWYGERLLIPPVPPSFLEGCSIIDIRYFATMTVYPSGVGKELNVPIEVIIGSIPLTQVTQRYRVNLLPRQNRHPTNSKHGNTKSTNDEMHPTMSSCATPPPTYAESVIGRVNINDRKGEGQGRVGRHEGLDNFAPMYTYYNMEQRDPVSNFTVLPKRDRVS